MQYTKDFLAECLKNEYRLHNWTYVGLWANGKFVQSIVGAQQSLACYRPGSGTLSVSFKDFYITASRKLEGKFLCLPGVFRLYT